MVPVIYFQSCSARWPALFYYCNYGLQRKQGHTGLTRANSNQRAAVNIGGKYFHGTDDYPADFVRIKHFGSRLYYAGLLAFTDCKDIAKIQIVRQDNKIG